MNAGKQIQRDAAWYRAEHERVGRELDALTPAHAAAIGDAAVRRLHVDHETFLQLAEEHEAHVARFYPELVEATTSPDEVALF